MVVVITRYDHSTYLWYWLSHNGINIVMLLITFTITITIITVGRIQVDVVQVLYHRPYIVLHCCCTCGSDCGDCVVCMFGSTCDGAGGVIYNGVSVRATTTATATVRLVLMRVQHITVYINTIHILPYDALNVLPTVSIASGTCVLGW